MKLYFNTFWYCSAVCLNFETFWLLVGCLFTFENVHNENVLQVFHNENILQVFHNENVLQVFHNVNVLQVFHTYILKIPKKIGHSNDHRVVNSWSKNI